MAANKNQQSTEIEWKCGEHCTHKRVPPHIVNDGVKMHRKSVRLTKQLLVNEEDAWDVAWLIRGAAEVVAENFVQNVIRDANEKARSNHRNFVTYDDVNDCLVSQLASAQSTTHQPPHHQ